VLVNVFDKMLRLLHPFMPFVSEEIWQVIRPYLDEQSLAAHLPIAKYPEASATNPLSAAEETAMNHCIEATESINSLRSLLGWHPGQRVNAVIKATGATDASELESWRRYAMTLAKLETLKFDTVELNRAVFTHLEWADVGVEAPEGYDFEVARQKLQKQLDEVGKHAAQHEARLNDSRFMSKADPETKVEVAQRFEGLQAQQKLLTAQLQQLGENA
jgi:valyl-tRNA synthetase